MDLNGLWGPKWLKKAIRYAGYAAVGVCVVGTAGLCGVAAGAAFAASAAYRSVDFARTGS
jgi:hypothetical protein